QQPQGQQPQGQQPQGQQPQGQQPQGQQPQGQQPQGQQPQGQQPQGAPARSPVSGFSGQNAQPVQRDAGSVNRQPRDIAPSQPRINAPESVKQRSMPDMQRPQMHQSQPSQQSSPQQQHSVPPPRSSGGNQGHGGQGREH
ncbi:MAG: hypothetical protein ACAH12_05660, partial [Methylophilaceae bacterium]